MPAAALDGVRVVELATMVSGPYCGKLLADLGADVIKVEPPEGDPSRGCGPFPGGDPHPERSPLYLYLNTSKRGVCLELESAAGRGELETLLAEADVLIDNQPPAALERLGLGWESLHARYPGLIYTAITPYGRQGPRAGVAGDELTLIHAGGLGNLLPARSSDVDRAPVKIGGYQVGYHGGIAAALATLGAVLGKRENGGEGLLIDLSLQEVILSMVSPLVASNRYHRTTWCRVPDRPPAMGRMQTADGYVILNAFDDHHFRAFTALMGDPEYCAGEEWDSLAYRSHHLMQIAPQIEAWVAAQKKADLHCRAGECGIPIGPISSAREVMESAQYEARGYFQTVEHPRVGSWRYAGTPYRLSASPARVSRPAPGLGEHSGARFAESPELSGPPGSPGSGPDRQPDPEPPPGGPTREPPRGDPGQEPPIGDPGRPLPQGDPEPQRPPAGDPAPDRKVRSLPLAGVRVVELCWVWAGPYAGRLLAALGAEVIKVESHRRTDLMRRGVVWPLSDPAPTPVPPNQGLAYNSVNLDKRSLTLDLTKPRGVELARELCRICDVVVDNMRPGALDKLGLGYEALRELREDLVVASSSGRGRGGPESSYLGYAMVHQGVGGGAYITGYPDDHPSHSGGDVDLMNAMTLAFAITAALYHRRRTGVGQFIDYSQCEGVSSLIGEVLLAQEMTGESAERLGNRHPELAPHGVYRAWGVDRWLAIEVHSEPEFAALCEVIGEPQLASDPRFATARARKANEEELDRLIESWTRQRDRDWMAGVLNRAGVAAAPSRTGADLYADPHLRERGAFIGVKHPELGEIELVDVPWRVERWQVPTRPAPLLGQDNGYVLEELLGLSPAAVEELRDQDVILAGR